MRTFAVLVATSTLALVGAGTAPALAGPATAYADVVGNVRITSPSTAEVRARYLCTADDPAVALWVSVKQGPALAEPAHTSSRDAVAWAQSHPQPLGLICDGKNHVGTFTVNQHEPGAGGPRTGFGTLTKGAKTYVQFCITPASSQSEQDVVSGMEFVTAV